MSEKIPEAGELCEYCPYREAAGNAFRESVLGSRNGFKLKEKMGDKKNEDNYDAKTPKLFYKTRFSSPTRVFVSLAKHAFV